MRKYLNDYLDFCVKVFWCRWDKAVVNWVGFYLIATLFTYMGISLEILHGGKGVWLLLSISLFITIITTSISYRRKNVQGADEMLQGVKNKEIDT